MTTIAEKYFPAISPEQRLRFEQLPALYREWNDRINVVSRKDIQNFEVNHLLHSLAIAQFISFLPGTSVIDVGTGGGLPGIPLAILRERWSVVLMDSIQKKCTAVADILYRLKLSGRVAVVCGRAEEKGVLAKLTGRFDLVLARGVAPLSDLVRWSRPYLKRGQRGSTGGQAEGHFQLTPPALLAYKGGDLEDEIRQMQIKVRADVSASIPLVFDGSDTIGLLDKKLIVVTP